MTNSDSSVRLRHFPFPYRAALAICSDIDDCSRRTYLAVHRFLNDPRDGLGLPVSDSFFPLGRDPDQMAYFLADGRTPGPDAEFIVEACRAGLIDSIHSWGDFNVIPPEPSTLRAMAERLTEDFLRRGLKIEIWINHGDPGNVQNLKSRLQPGYHGDDPRSGFYTADLVRVLGVRYYWWSDLVTWPLSCCNAPFLESCCRQGLNLVKNCVKVALLRAGRTRTSAEISELIHPVMLRDGLPLMAFTRHLREYKEPSSRHTLHYTLAAPVLEDLLAQEGYLVLCTHLGTPRPDRGELFSTADREALGRLADYFHEGKIWVAPTGRVLNHRFMTKYLAWEASREGETLFIDLHSLDDPLTGARVPHLDELAGLCFYVPASCRTVFRLSGREVVPKTYGTDHTGSLVVGLDSHAPPDTALLREFR